MSVSEQNFEDCFILGCVCDRNKLRAYFWLFLCSRILTYSLTGLGWHMEFLGLNLYQLCVRETPSLLYYLPTLENWFIFFQKSAPGNPEG